MTSSLREYPVFSAQVSSFNRRFFSEGETRNLSRKNRRLLQARWHRDIRHFTDISWHLIDRRNFISSSISIHSGWNHELRKFFNYLISFLFFSFLSLFLSLFKLLTIFSWTKSGELLFTPIFPLDRNPLVWLVVETVGNVYLFKMEMSCNRFLKFLLSLKSIFKRLWFVLSLRI